MSLYAVSGTTSTGEHAEKFVEANDLNGAAELATGQGIVKITAATLAGDTLRDPPPQPESQPEPQPEGRRMPPPERRPVRPQPAPFVAPPPPANPDYTAILLRIERKAKICATGITFLVALIVVPFAIGMLLLVLGGLASGM